MIYFNTNTFDSFTAQSMLPITRTPEKAELLVLGSKKPNYKIFKKLKAVYRFGVGTDNIDFEWFKSNKVKVYFPGETAKLILYEATANFTVIGIFHLLSANSFGEVDIWRKTKRQFIGHKRVLVIGNGNIGSRVVKKLSPFMQVDIYDIRFNHKDELKPLIHAADIITIHIPLTKENNKFFNTEKLSWVKDTALLINTSRGRLFDEDALFDKLKISKCRAFFDVFWEEPYHGPLKSFGQEKFFMTPHSSSNTIEFLQAGFSDILEVWKELNNG